MKSTSQKPGLSHASTFSKVKTTDEDSGQNVVDAVQSAAEARHERIVYTLLLVVRYLVLLTLCFVFGISLLYAIGSVVSLKTENLFCPQYSEKEVRQHSYQNGLSKGDPDSCFYINRKKLNINEIENLNLEIFKASKVFSITNSLRCSLYSMVLLFIICNCIYHGWICLIVKDTKYACSDLCNPRIRSLLIKIKNKQVSKITEAALAVSDGYSQDERCTSLHSVKTLKDRYWYDDSKFQLFTKACKEIFEILVQLFALMLYGGLNVFDPSQNILAQETRVVRGFAIIVSLNCLASGILFLLYILKHDIMHGKLFSSLLFVSDAIFEMIYCLFPLMYLTSGDSIFDLKSLSLLNEQNFFIFFQSLVAVIMLTKSCYSLLQDLNPTKIITKYWIQRIQRSNINVNSIKQTPWIPINNDDNGIYGQYFTLAMWYNAITNRSLQTAQITQQIDHIYCQNHVSTANTLDPPSTADTDTTDTSDISNPSESTELTDVGDAADIICAHDAAEMVQLNQIVKIVDKGEDSSENSEKNVHVHSNAPSKQVQFRRKSIVVLFGCALILVGVCVLVMFLSFIQFEFDSKCVNPSNAVDSGLIDSDWLERHPELRIYNKYCKKQVVNVFNYEYPCNCRLFGISKNSSINTNYNNISISQDELEMSLIKYTNLEAISIALSEDMSENIANKYNLTKEMFSNLEYLKVLRLLHMNIYNIDESIKKLTKLEILIIDYNNAPFWMPFESISQIKSLRAIELNSVPSMLNPEIPETICDLHLVQYFEITFWYRLTKIPSDCIATNWKKLAHFNAPAQLFMDYIDPRFWLLPSLSSVLLDFSGVNQSTLQFDTFLGYSDALSVVSLYGSTRICGTGGDNSKIIISNVEYNGFGYLNDMIISNDSNYDYDAMYPLLSFIEKFDPCYPVCKGNVDGAVANCVFGEWKDGVCDELCNNEACNWDGGDCMQTCDIYSFDNSNHDDEDTTELSTKTCNSTLLFNNECDIGCNTTQCNYDSYSCASVSTTHQNETCISSDDIICYKEWSNDLWCDNNCNNIECNYDNNECSSCVNDHEDGECSRAYYLMEIAAGIEKPYELLTIDELCDYYEGYEYLGYVPDGIDSCTEFFTYCDQNNNGFVGFHEAIICSSQVMGLDIDDPYDAQKLAQINCSLCMKNQSLYYL